MILTRTEHFSTELKERIRSLSLAAVEGSRDSSSLLGESLYQLNCALEELRTTEEALRDQSDALVLERENLEVGRADYARLFDLAPIPYLVTDSAGAVRAANAAATRFFGADRDRLIGKPLAVFVPPEARSELRRFVRDAAGAADCSERVLLVRPYGGEEMRVEARVSSDGGAEGGGGQLRWILQPARDLVVVADPAGSLGEGETGQTFENSFSLGRAAAGMNADGLRRWLSERIGAALYFSALADGDRLPSMRELSRQTGLNHKTVRRAYRALESQGVIEIRDRSGVYVAGREAHTTGAGHHDWPARVVAEGWAHGISLVEIGRRISELTAARFIRCACLEETADDRAALRMELQNVLGMEVEEVAIRGDRDREDGWTPELVRRLQGFDVVVTTSFHAGRARKILSDKTPVLDYRLDSRWVSAIRDAASQGRAAIVCVDPLYRSRVAGWLESLEMGDVEVLLVEEARSRNGGQTSTLVATPAARQRLGREGAAAPALPPAIPYLSADPRLELASLAISLNAAAGSDAGPGRLRSAPRSVPEPRPGHLRFAGT